MKLRRIDARRHWAMSVTEYVKTALRNALHQWNLDLVRDPASSVLIRTLRWLEIDTVIDVGANIGQYGSGIRASGFRGRIVSCEPLPDAFVQLKKRAAKDPRWTALHTAVGASTGTIEINVSANSYSSSVLTITDAHLRAAPRSRVTHRVQVPLVTVADLVKSEWIVPPRTLLKVDTQGYEGSVLDGAGNFVSDFTVLQLELSFVPLYEGQTLFGEMVGRLRESGFGMFSIEPGFADPTTGRMLQCDVIFVRQERLETQPICRPTVSLDTQLRA